MPEKNQNNYCVTSAEDSIQVLTNSVSHSTLDECPMAYKNMHDILDNIDPTVIVEKIIRPIYNFKAGEE